MPEPARDPNWLYATVAGVMATVVAILGGFVLTYGLQLGTQIRRIAREVDRFGPRAERWRLEVEADKHKAAELTTDDVGRGVFARVLGGELDLREADAELDRLKAQRSQQINVALKDAIERQQRMDRDLDDFRRAQEDLEDLRALNGVIFRGLFLLIVVAGSGVVFPVTLLPYDEASAEGWHEGAVKVAFLVSTLIVLLFVISIRSAVAGEPHRDRTPRSELG